MMGFLTKVAVVDYLVVTQIWGLALGIFHKYESCDNSCHNVTQPLRNITNQHNSTKMNVAKRHYYSQLWLKIIDMVKNS
jgi:hypothetical protein